MIQGKIQLSKPQKHELNNEGCLCEMCQKIGREQLKRIVLENYVDTESERYNLCKKEEYINIIHKMSTWQPKTRKLRFLLPEICVYENSQPAELISKKQENQHAKINRDKAKLHMFEITQFFLEGFVYHNPEVQRNPKKKKILSFKLSNHSDRYRNECIVIAKYKDNFHELLTLTQMEGLFKSRHKQMRNGLMYVQTLVCTKDFCQTRIPVNLAEMMKSDKFERAKNEVRMLHDEIKPTDVEYIKEEEEISFEKKVKERSIREYLEYLTLKIVLALSKKQQTAISEAVFKYVHSKGSCFLVDVRVEEMAPSEQFWTSGAMKMYELKLSQRMKMLDMPPESRREQEGTKLVGRPTRSISNWLEKTTENQWDQMKTIRARLERLDRQKRELMQSQSVGERGKEPNRDFKVRRISKV